MKKKTLIIIGVVVTIVILAIIISPEARDSFTNGIQDGAN